MYFVCLCVLVNAFALKTLACGFWKREAPVYDLTNSNVLFIFVHDTSHSLERKIIYLLLLPLFFYSFLYNLFYFCMYCFEGATLTKVMHCHQMVNTLTQYTIGYH